MTEPKITFGMLLGILAKAFLFTLIIVSTIDFLFKFNGAYLLFGRKEIIIFGLLFSMVCFLIFPLFSVGKYLQTQDIKTINDCKQKYKLDFFFLFIGFVGLYCWYISKNVCLIVIGFILILFCLSWIVISIHQALKEDHNC